MMSIRRSTGVLLCLVLVLGASPSSALAEPASRPCDKRPGKKCGGVDFNSPEGGLVGLQARVTPDGGITAITLAYFMSHTAMPEAMPLFMGECVRSETSRWSEGQPEERTYFHVGTLTLSGADEDIVLDPQASASDREGRHHDVGYFDERSPGQPYLRLGAEYDIHFAGSADFPETTYESALYLPVAYQEIDPGQPAFGPIVMERGTDRVWTWVPGDNSAASGLQYHFIGFWDGMSMTHMCIHEDSGEFTVPGATLDEIPAVGFAVYGAFNVRILELEGGDISGRRLDLMGVYYYATPYIAVP